MCFTFDDGVKYQYDVALAVLEDLKLSRIGRRLIPYQFECKSQEKFKVLYSFYDQSCRHGKHEPTLIIKQNTRRALAVIDLDQFIDLIK